MASNSGWNKNVPSGTSSIAQGDDDIRSFKSFMQAWWEEEHYATDGSANSAGEHKPGSARAYVGTASQLSNPETGRIFWLTDEADIAVAPNASSWSRLGAVRSGSTNTFTQLQVFSSGVSTSRVSIGADTAIYRAGANHLKTDGTFEASVISTPTLRGINQLSLGTLQVGSGVSIKGIYQLTVVFPVASFLSQGQSQTTTIALTHGLTAGDILICEQDLLNQDSLIRAWISVPESLIRVARHNLGPTQSFSTATLNILAIDIT